MIRIAIAGIGKIARDQHIPHIAANRDFELIAAVTRHEPPSGVSAFTTIGEMMAAGLGVEAIAICTPPIGRLALVREAFDHGLDVLIEKPPAATLSEAEQFATIAGQADRVLFVTWHLREAAAVEPACKWLADRTMRSVRVDWRENVRVWHPGQEWIWQPGIGVFDPGINALSVITRILPGPLCVEASELRFPSNKPAPIAASLTLKGPNPATIAVEFDFDQRGPQCWDIAVETDGGTLQLADGASKMAVDGVPVEVGDEAEYARLYRRFAELIAARRSDVDLAPFRLVADAFLIGRRSEVGPFGE
ncbi:MAG: Gfo/Idh/MocA family protein [Sphingomicrobium sp.]|nr:Gfo/Idh/MocA family oxidoreductase [Sphingomonadales bacterium]